MSATPPESLPAVSKTALGVAGLRAAETARPDRLFEDPYAATFFAAGRALFPEAAEDRLAKTPENDLGALFYAQVVIRTRFYDDYLLGASSSQVVLLAAGLDTRAFRLRWPSGVRLFELDLPDVLSFKNEVLEHAQAAPRCDRVVVPADLREDWPTALLSAGFDPSLPTAWLIEGLLIYLTHDEAAALLTRVTTLSAPGSRMAFEYRTDKSVADLISRGRALPHARPVTDLWKGGLAVDARDWLSDHGWTSEPHLRADLADSYGRTVNDPTGGGFLTATLDRPSDSRTG